MWLQPECFLKVKSFKPIPLDALKEYVEVLTQAIDDQRILRESYRGPSLVP